MLLLAAALVLVPFAGSETPMLDRHAFHKNVQRVAEGMNKKQVEGILGSPDDIWPPNDDHRYVSAGMEAWCYGTSGHHTFPTLGRVLFKNGKVEWVLGKHGTPPAKGLISEDELTDAMRSIHRWDERFNDHDSLRLIQATNKLYPLGKDKALAVLLEYDRLSGFGGDDTWMFWLARVLFTSKAPGGVFPVPRIGALTPEPPKDLRKWPTYPVINEDDIPVVLMIGRTLFGSPEQFRSHVQSNSKDWAFRTAPLSPPDDPFLALKKIIASPEWPFPRNDPENDRFAVPFREKEGIALERIMSLVKTAYRPSDGEHYFNGLDIDKYHKEFLRVGARWDPVKQMYVKADGSIIQDLNKEYPQYIHKFRGIPGFDIEISFTRSVEEGVSFSVSTDEIEDRMYGVALMEVIDAKTGAELYWMAINDMDSRSFEEGKEKAMAKKPHKRMQGGMGAASGFSLEPGRQIKFRIRVDAKTTYTSPVFAL